MDFLSGLISAGAKIFGAVSDANNQDNSNLANFNQAQQNRMDQLTYAQNSIKWRVDDANRAGINPLAALGAPGLSFSNQAGSSDAAKTGEQLGNAGQDIGRAVAAQSPMAQRAAELDQKLTEAKIANVNSDTVKNTADASKVATTLGAPGLPPARVPLPQEDPRGPVINLMQRARDVDGSIVWIPSDKAASPLQTLGAMPTNAAMAARSAKWGLFPDDMFSNFNSALSRGDSWRAGTEYGVIP